MGLLGIIVCAVARHNMVDSLMGAMTFGGILYLIRCLSGGKLGLGDVKLGLAVGIWLGPRASVAALYISFALGGVYAIGYLLKMVTAEGVEGLWKARGRALPFGPFLALGSSVGLLYGESIADIYMSFFWQTVGTAL
ncbi:Leader peptidase (Prepilin peptidase) / N-methyltransferase [Anaerovibrio sp. JC8]|nr:Leader peptidase (Prepilin peptidase) / N-methyltransferase [Anaerovibrio sp. JC8]